MNESTEWVRCPVPAPKGKLPVGTLCRFEGSHGPVFRMMSEFSVHEGEAERGLLLKLPSDYCFDGSELVKKAALGAWRAREDDDLGDTPAHLRELLRAARERAPGTVLTSLEFGYALWRSEPGWNGLIFNERDRGEPVLRMLECDVLPGRRNRGGLSREQLREAIEQGRCYPTADARRIGREEFGMVFDDEDSVRVRGADGGIYTSRGYIPGSAIAGATNEKPSRVLTSLLFAEKPPACACGATTNLRQVVIERSASVTVYSNRCGACEQERRRAELLAEMDRKLPPKEPEKSLAPPTWPEGSGDNYEL
jgi:hypothetical protein